MSLKNLKQINFCDTSTSNVEKDIINAYEAIANKKLYPGDPVRLFLEAIASIITQQRVIIDFSGKQNLLAYAQGDYLDQVVALVGVKRLDASSARCTIRFTLSNAQTSVMTIPKGTRVKAGELYFATIEDSIILPGELIVDVMVECMTPGVTGNGLVEGQINQLVDVFPYFSHVTNTTTTTGGTDEERDDALRQRAYEAPSSYSCAGSDSAYAFWAKTVSPEIGDVAVITPKAGEVNIIPIGVNGELLSEELRNKILARCSEKNVKPLTDKVSVIQPTKQNYALEMTYWIDRKDVAMATAIQNQVNQAIAEYKIWQQSKLGRDINPSELIYRVMQAGAKRVQVTSPSFTTLESTSIAHLASESIVFGGVEDA